MGFPAALQDPLQTPPGVQSCFAGNGASQWASNPWGGCCSGRRGIRITSSSGGGGEGSFSTSLPVCVSHLILAHQLVRLWSCADGGGDATSRTTTHGGSAPLQEPPACRGWGSPGTSGVGITRFCRPCPTALRMGFPSGLAG